MRREPAEQSNRVRRREVTGRCLEVGLDLTYMVVQFKVVTSEGLVKPVKLFLILSSLQCCDKTVSKVAPRVKQRHRQLKQC